MFAAKQMAFQEHEVALKVAAQTLRDEITEDEKLLVVDRDLIMMAYSSGAREENMHITRGTTKPDATNYYKDKYGTDGKH